VIRALTRAAANMCSTPGEPPRRAQIFIVEATSFTITAEDDVDGIAVMERVTMALGEHPYVRQVVANKEAVVSALDYAQFGGEIASVVMKSGVKNGAWIPIEHRGEVYAVLAVSGRQDALVSDAQLVRLKTLASIGELALNNARTHQHVAEMARTDPLTGLANRRALSERMRQLPRTNFAILAMDVDNLKRINDSHGHQIGDIVLREMGELMEGTHSLRRCGRQDRPSAGAGGSSR